MTFTSGFFAVFLLVTFALYYFPPFRNFQVYLLIISSMVLYGLFQPYQLLILTVSFIINIVSSYFAVHSPPERRKVFLITGITLNIALLVFYKYSATIFGWFETPAGSPTDFLLALVVPAGLSFQTFQGIGMLLDVYRKNEREGMLLVPVSFARHLRQTLLFKSFFPQLIAGPITRAPAFIPQIGRKQLAEIRWNRVFRYLITGYFLKMVVADNLQEFTFWIMYPFFLKQGAVALVTILFGYSCQIFADFAGYSLIAIGLGHLFGYSLPENFNFPYVASSVKEFWTRWHISLSTWLRDYLFLPVAYSVSRKLPGNSYLGIKTENIIYSVATMVTFFICGVWHGSGIGFMIWGLLFGIAMVFERFWNIWLKKVFGKGLKKRPVVMTRNFTGWIISFSFVSILWLFFRLPEPGQVRGYLTCLFGNEQPNDYKLIISIIMFSLPVILYHLYHLFSTGSLIRRIRPYSFLFYGIMLFFIILNSGPSGQFIYFQF